MAVMCHFFPFTYGPAVYCTLWPYSMLRFMALVPLQSSATLAGEYNATLASTLALCTG
jgi:hypothetical protein